MSAGLGPPARMTRSDVQPAVGGLEPTRAGHADPPSVSTPAGAGTPGARRPFGPRPFGPRPFRGRTGGGPAFRRAFGRGPTAGLPQRRLQFVEVADRAFIGFAGVATQAAQERVDVFVDVFAGFAEVFAQRFQGPL